MTKKITIVITILSLIVLSAVFGLVGGEKLAQSKIETMQSEIDNIKKSAYKAGYDTATTQFIDAKIYDPVANTLGPKKLRGPIIEMEGNKLKVALSAYGPISDIPPMVRTVNFTNETKMYQQINRERLAYQKELVAYHQKLLESLESGQTSTTSPVMPSVFEKKDMTSTELKPGMNITVIYEDDNEGGDIVVKEIYTQDIK